MTGLVFSPLVDNEAVRRTGHHLLPATLGETLGATFDDPTLAPSDLLGTALDIRREQGLLPAEEDFNLVGPGGIIAAEDPETGMMRDESELSDLVSPEDLNERYGALGLKFDKPTRRRVAEILAEVKRDERRRADIIARGPQGIVATGARFGAALARTAIDPVNVAAAFIPIVSQARFAGLVAKTGLTRARLARGAIEGAVGNALIEPGIAGLATQQQLDYEMSDALVNVALGGLLGGGLHVGLGKVADRLARHTPETREAALRASVAQLATGRRVDVTPVFDASQTTRQRLLGTAAPVRLPDGRLSGVALPENVPLSGGVPVRGGEPAGMAREFRTVEAREPKGRKGKSLIQWIREQGGIKDVGGELRAMDAHRLRPGLVNNKSGLDIDDLRLRAAVDEGFFAEEPDLNAFREAIRRELAKEERLVRAVDREDDLSAREFEAIQADREEFADRAGIDIVGMTDTQIDNAIRDFQSQADELDLETEIQLSREQFAEVAAREAAPEKSSAADFEAAAVDIHPREAQEEVDFVSEVAAELERQGAIDAADLRTLREADAVLANAEAKANATRTAAVCLMRPAA